MTSFGPSRTEAMRRLAQFVPRAGRAYAAQRNFDLGAGNHTHVSTLSPYLRHRIVTEEDVLQAILARHSPQAAEKFVQEVFWRTYWKGWLELRPAVWRQYLTDLRRALDNVQTQSGLRSRWEDACLGRTGITCFDAWAYELAATGYLHNHARMWFASIWVFTLHLPWQLGADFFMRHLLDGDPASNTLGWRWVAGIQTPGKSYLARPDNIAKYTEGRFRPTGLAKYAPPVDAPTPPSAQPAPIDAPFDPTVPTAFVLHPEDLSPGWLLDGGVTPLGTAIVDPTDHSSPLNISPKVMRFRKGALNDVTTRWSDRLGPVTHGLTTGAALSRWATELGARQIVTAHAPTGPMQDVLNDIQDITLVRRLRPYDARAWPHATAGFFKFRKAIPGLLSAMSLPA